MGDALREWITISTTRILLARTKERAASPAAGKGI
jgi:hypothetical protein